MFSESTMRLEGIKLRGINHCTIANAKQSVNYCSLVFSECV